MFVAIDKVEALPAPAPTRAEPESDEGPWSVIIRPVVIAGAVIGPVIIGPVMMAIVVPRTMMEAPMMTTDMAAAMVMAAARAEIGGL